MSAEPIDGFPLPDDYGSTRVPNAILGRLLSEIRDAETIVLILRAVWLIERQRGYPRYVTVPDLERDRVLSAALSEQRRFDECLKTALELGILVEVTINRNRCLMINSVSARRAAIQSTESTQVVDDEDGGWDEPARSTLPIDAFRAYEENIGTLSPMIRESIMTALQDFTDEEISDAIRIAVENESRSWSFIAGVLRRWLREGVPNDRRYGKSGGEPGRERISQAELRKYLDAQRKRSRSASK